VARPLEVVVPNCEPWVVVVLHDHRTVLDRECDLRIELGVVLRVTMAKLP